MGDDVGVFVLVGGEQEAEGEAAGVGVGVCVGDGLGVWGQVCFLLVVVMIGWVLWGTYGEAGGGGETGEERSAWGCEVRCAGER